MILFTMIFCMHSKCIVGILFIFNFKMAFWFLLKIKLYLFIKGCIMINLAEWLIVLIILIGLSFVWIKKYFRILNRLLLIEKLLIKLGIFLCKMKMKMKVIDFFVFFIFFFFYELFCNYFYFYQLLLFFFIWEHNIFY
jgi:hypothetical protein